MQPAFYLSKSLERLSLAERTMQNEVIANAHQVAKTNSFHTTAYILNQINFSTGSYLNGLKLSMKILHHISLLWFTCHFHRSVENEMLINDYLVNLS